MEQWTVCWVNRRCLPALVHDALLDEIFHSRVSLARGTINDDGKSPIENFNSLPGPSSPAFIKKLMPLDVEDAHIQHELQEGRVVPWELKKENLEHIVGRTEIAIRDKSTVDMRIDRFIDGTRSSSESVPMANTQEFFHDRGHKATECPSPFKKCGDSMRQHATTLVGGQCKRGCVRCDDPGHQRDQCNRLCRLCIVEKNSNTELKDCKKHCPLHLCLTPDGQDHSRCVSCYEACPLCKGRHWHQDCPRWLETLCVRQDCLTRQCNAHCHVCGGLTIDGITTLFAMNDNVAYRQQVHPLVQALVWKWHNFLDNWQWERISASDADTQHSPWSVLRCKRHADVTADARILGRSRAGTWEKVVNCVRGGFTKGAVSEAVKLLQVPECGVCFEQHTHEEAGTGKFEKHYP